MQRDVDGAEWQAALRHVDAMRDRLGMRVDDAIRETVAILNVMGVHTTMSCAGHTDRDTGGPYVTFIHRDIVRWRDLVRDIDDPSDVQYKHAIQHARELNYTARKKLWDHLELYYQDRATGYAQRLSIQVRPFSNTLMATGAVNYSFLNPKERKEALRHGQDEMQYFTEYLKMQYGQHE